MKVTTCVFSLYTLLKVVSHYDFSVLSMSVMGFQKKKCGCEVGGVSSTQFYFGLLEFFNFAKPLVIVDSFTPLTSLCYKH